MLIRSFERLPVVLRDAAAVGVHESEARLRCGVSLLSRQAKPPHGLGKVLRDVIAKVVLHPENVLRQSPALFSTRTQRIDLRCLRLYRHTTRAQLAQRTLTNRR